MLAPRRGHSLALAMLLIGTVSSSVHAGWGVDPVQVRATTALCPAVSAVADGQSGAVIAWQENDSTGGLIRAQHLFASGDLDPAWGGSVVVCDRSAARTVLGAVSAGVGGSYVWWMEGPFLYLQRVTRIGTIAPGWPSGGRSIGPLLTQDYRPSVVPDGESGVYIGMLTSPLNTTDSYVRVTVKHMNASGGGADGWPVGGRQFGVAPYEGYWTVSSLGLDAVPDGGLWLGWQALRGSGDVDGAVFLVRLTTAGLPASGWSATGDSLAPFYKTFQGATSQAAPFGSQVGVAHDDAGGAFVLSRQPSFDSIDLSWNFENSLRHVDGSGAPAPGWSAGGIILSSGPEFIPAAPTAEASVRALADDRGGVFNGLPLYASESTSSLDFTHRSSMGDVLPGGVDGAQQGIEVVPRGDGGMFVASFKPSGATGPNESDAYISVSQSDPGTGFFESKGSLSATRYGDVGLTATGEGGAIFAWSQLIDRQGVYAIRLGQAGVVTGVPPTPVIGPPSLRVRYVRGSGVHAVASFAGSPRLALSLHDLAGRRVASFTSDATLGADVVFPGTRDLPGGVYFARASDGTRVLNARVIVLL